MQAPEMHPFHQRPNRTLIALSFPVLFSLIAEPLTGLIDTAFVKVLGSGAMSALGAGTVALTSLFWVFNFLMIGTQTEVAHALGKGKQERAIKVMSLSLVLAVLFGLLLTAILVPFATQAATLMGAEDTVATAAADYIRLRALGAPAVLLMSVGFGAMRGKQDMRTPLYIAVAVNVLNILLDMVLIFGAGPIPALGISGSALASTLAQYVGAIWAVFVVVRGLGFTWQFRFSDATDLLKVGRDLFFRTGLLMTFTLIATRVATQIGPDSGAAHAAIRQVWLFSSLIMEAFATTAQSLVGYFLGSMDVVTARRVARYVVWWSLGTGFVAIVFMLLITPIVIDLLVPAAAIAVFMPAWLVSSLSQPLNALAFITDGIHWGTSDYKYLRNGMFAATCSGVIALLLIDTTQPDSLIWVWFATSLWMTVRAIFGVGRIWPGIGDNPLRLGKA